MKAIILNRSQKGDDASDTMHAIIVGDSQVSDGKLNPSYFAT